MRLTTRLNRLERGKGATAAASNGAPPHLWDVLCGAKKADDLPAADRARLEGWWATRREESKGCRLAFARKMADQMRPECEPLGVSVPTAEELVEREDREQLDIVQQLLRLLESTPPASPALTVSPSVAPDRPTTRRAGP